MPPHDVVANCVARLVGNDMDADIWDLLREGYASLRRRSRLSNVNECTLKALLTYMIDGIAGDVQATKGDSLWKEHDHIDIPVLARTESTRSRRVPIAFKTSLAIEVASSECVNASSQFLAVKILERRQRRGVWTKALEKEASSPWAGFHGVCLQATTHRAVAHSSLRETVLGDHRWSSSWEP